MKKFHFTLDKLAGYKDQLLKREKNELSKLRVEEKEILEEIEELGRKIISTGEEFNQKSMQGVSVNEIMVYQDFIKSLRDGVEEAKKRLEEKRVQIEKQMKVVMELSMDVNSMEKLREKQLEEYKAMVAKADEQFIAEFVQRRDFAKRQ